MEEDILERAKKKMVCILPVSGCTNAVFYLLQYVFVLRCARFPAIYRSSVELLMYFVEY